MLPIFSNGRERHRVLKKPGFSASLTIAAREKEKSASPMSLPTWTNEGGAMATHASLDSQALDESPTGKAQSSDGATTPLISTLTVPLG